MKDQLPAAPLRTYLASLPDEQRQLVSSLRDLIFRTCPQATETLLWNSLSYHRANFGGRVKGAICLVTPREDCVHLGFIHGAAIPDPHHLLQGARKAKRFVPVRAKRDLLRKGLAELISAAANYDPREGAQR